MTPTNDNEARKWAAIAHLSSLVWIPLVFVGLSFPILNILGPLIVWLSKKSDSRFIDEQGKESLNFQISFTIYTFILLVLLAIVAFIFGVILFGSGGNPNSSAAQSSFMATILGLGLLAGAIILIMAIIQLILVIIATVKAKNGQHYRYPLTIRFLR